jgi:hypothetical protein
MIDGLALLGAQAVICGVGAVLAQRMVNSNLNQRAYDTAIDLASAITLALLDSPGR